MFGKPFTLFRVFGFAVRVDWSWLIILTLVIWSLAGAVFPLEFPGRPAAVYVAMGVAGAVGLFASIVLHELSHSLVARRYGMEMKGITLFIFGGVAEMADEPDSPAAEFWMAIAGPIASVLIAGVAYSAALATHLAGAGVAATGVLLWVGLINLMLAGFNLVPGFPLDGGRVLRSILWHFQKDLRRATRVAAGVGGGFGLALIVLGFATFLTRDFIGGLWWILIGMFLRGAARQSYQQLLLRQALAGQTVEQFMDPDPVTVPGSLSLEDAVQEYVYKRHASLLPVVEQGRLAGCVTTDQIKAVPAEEWPWHTAGELVRPCGPENTVGPDEPVLPAFATMNRGGNGQLMVVRDGALVGVLSAKDLVKFLSLKLELEGGRKAA